MPICAPVIRNEFYRHPPHLVVLSHISGWLEIIYVYASLRFTHIVLLKRQWHVSLADKAWV